MFFFKVIAVAWKGISEMSVVSNRSHQPSLIELIQGKTTDQVKWTFYTYLQTFFPPNLLLHTIWNSCQLLSHSECKVTNGVVVWQLIRKDGNNMKEKVTAHSYPTGQQHNVNIWRMISILQLSNHETFVILKAWVMLQVAVTAEKIFMLKYCLNRKRTTARARGGGFQHHLCIGDKCEPCVWRKELKD